MPRDLTDSNYDGFDFAVLPNREAIVSFDNKTLLSRYHYLDTLAQEHAIAFTVAKMLDEDLLSETHAAIADALKNGTSFNDFKKRLKPYLMSKGWWGEQVMGDPKDGQINKVQLGSTRRLRTIYHTNKRTAYAAGQWQRIQQTKAALPFLQYMKTVAAKPRQEHKRYYNLVLPVDHPLWKVIFPPNKYGCLCWVKQLTRAQAEALGVSDDADIEYEEIVNERTGDVVRVPKGIHPSFAHNHDRMTAMRELYADKLAGWAHVADDARAAYRAAFEAALDRYMLDLVKQSDFNSLVPVVTGEQFARRLRELDETVKAAGGNRKNSLALRKEHAQGELWAVATLSPRVQDQLDVETALVWLSDDTLVKMLAHHPKETTQALFKSVQGLLSQAVAIDTSDGVNAVYFTQDDKYYKATVKSTKDKKELYLTTVFEMRERDFKKKVSQLRN